MDAGYDEFSVSPKDVLSNAGPQQSGYVYPAQSEQYRQAGLDPLSGVAPLFASNKRQQASSGRSSVNSAEAKNEASPFFRDATFYANAIGDVGAAQTLMKTNGRSAFQMFDSYDFELGDGDKKDPTNPSGKMTFRIVPRGSRQITMPDGRRADIPVWDLARRSGVTTVAFKGGDEQADKFRDTVSRAQGLLKSIAELEKHYNSSMMMGGYMPTTSSGLSKALESKIVMDYGAVMNGMKGVGGSVSESDMELIRAMTPQRASTWWTRLGGNEKALLKQVKLQVLDKLKDTARVNGIDLLPETHSKGKQINEASLLGKSKSFD